MFLTQKKWQAAALVLGLAAGLASPPRAAAQSLPQAPGAQVTDLTQEPGYFTEPTIAVDPNHPQHIVAAFQDNVHVSYSTDSGATWKAARNVAPPDFRVSGDVSVTYDNQGRAYVCYIAFDKLGSFNYWAHGATRNGIFVRRSLDGGEHWESRDHPVAEQRTEPGIPFEDKPYIVADTTNGPYGGNLYVGWTRWTLTNSLLLFSRSTDGGQTWSKPIEIDAHPGLPRDDNGALEGFSGAVGPDGTLYAVWSGAGDRIFFTQSHDGGRTFAPPRPVIETAPIMFHLQDLSRGNGFPVIDVDRRGPRAGRLVVAWSDYRNGDVDVFVSTSTDQGATWSAPVRVNDDPIHNGLDQFFHWLAVDPTDGSVDLVFYDRRNDPTNHTQTVSLARSTDGAHSFQNYAWTANPFDAAGIFLGDYTGIAAYAGRVYGIWTEHSKAAVKRSETDHKQNGTIVRVGVADFGQGAKISGK